MVPRIALLLLTTLFFFTSLVTGVSLQCSNFDEKLVENSCKVNQESLPANDRANLNFLLLDSLSDKSSRELAKDYNEDIPDSYFEKYAVDAESFYIDKAWVYVRKPYWTVKTSGGKSFSPSKGSLAIKTGYETNSMAEEGFIDIDNSPGSCSNQAKLLNVEESLKTNFSTGLDGEKLDYSLNRSAVVEATYTLKTKLEIRDRDLVCTGEERCNLECKAQGSVTTVEEEKFRDENTIRIVEVELGDFRVGKTSSATVFEINNSEKYLEANFSFGKDNLYLSKKAQKFQRVNDSLRFYPVYFEEFQTKKFSNSSISGRILDSNKVLINKSFESDCDFGFRTLSLGERGGLDCRTSSTNIPNRGLEDSVEVEGVEEASYFVIPLVMFIWIYWYMWS